MTPSAPASRIRRRFWLDTVALDDVVLAVEGGHREAPGTRDTRLARLGRGDGVVVHSARETAGSGPPLNRFTALGEVLDDEPFRAVRVNDGLDPTDGGLPVWRRRVRWEEVGGATSVPVGPLLPLLGFVAEQGEERRWRSLGRRGLSEIEAGDFAVIAGALRDAAGVDHAYAVSGRTVSA